MVIRNLRTNGGMKATNQTRQSLMILWKLKLVDCMFAEYTLTPVGHDYATDVLGMPEFDMVAPITDADEPAPAEMPEPTFIESGYIGDGFTREYDYQHPLNDLDNFDNEQLVPNIPSVGFPKTRKFYIVKNASGYCIIHESAIVDHSKIKGVIVETMETDDFTKVLQRRAELAKIDVDPTPEETLSAYEQMVLWQNTDCESLAYSRNDTQWNETITKLIGLGYFSTKTLHIKGTERFDYRIMPTQKLTDYIQNNPFIAQKTPRLAGLRFCYFLCFSPSKKFSIAKISSSIPPPAEW